MHVVGFVELAKKLLHVLTGSLSIHSLYIYIFTHIMRRIFTDSSNTLCENEQVESLLL